MTPHFRRGARGFSLVEVMVAVVVICVGLLGIAKMQALSLSNASTSRQRALAAIQAASLASAMHSNRRYWAGATVVPGITVTLQGTTVTAQGDPALQSQAQTYFQAAPGNLNQCVAAAAGTNPQCTPIQLAAFDLTRWWINSVNRMLPNATGTINCPQVLPGTQAPISCTIQLQWIEKAVGANNQAASVVGGQTSFFEIPTYTLYVQP